MTEGQWVGLWTVVQSLLAQREGRSLPWAWRGSRSSAPWRFTRMADLPFLLNFLSRSSEPSRWLPTASSPPPTQCVPAHWPPTWADRPSPLSSYRRSHHISHRLLAPPSHSACRIVLPTNFVYSSYPNALAHRCQVSACRGGHKAGAKIVSECQLSGPFSGVIPRGSWWPLGVLTVLISER